MEHRGRGDDAFKTVGTGDRLVDVDRVLVPHGFDPVPDHGLVHGVGRNVGGALGGTFERLQLGQESVAHRVAHRVTHRAARFMPRPAMATISRWTSFTPPPKVLICAPRAARSSRPRSTSPAEPGAR